MLAAIGTKMIWDGFKKHEEERPSRHSFAIPALTAVGTSIDALAVGITLAVKANIVVNAIAIGAATFLATTSEQVGMRNSDA